MQINLSGKNALITGAGRGIGRACAIELSKSGAAILANDRPGNIDLEKTRTEIEMLGNRCENINADVFSREGCEKLIENSLKKVGSIDILISNPALNIHQSFLDHDPKVFEEVINSTLISGFNIAQLVAQHMVSNAIKGKIIFISSVQAEMPYEKSAAYGSAKAGLNHLTRTIALELSRYRINVNGIQPGWIDTPGEHELFPEESIRRESVKLPWGRMGNASEIGKSVSFLASEQAEYITGSILTVDGAFRFKDCRII